MSAPSPPPPRTGLGPPPSLDGLAALLSGGGSTPSASTSSVTAAAAAANAVATNGSNKMSMSSTAPTSPTKVALPLSPTSASSTLLSPSHPHNLRKQAKTQLDPSFSVKSYVGAANALLEKARSSDAQGQAEQAFVNYMKAADVAANIPKHADWPKTVEQRGPTYYRYQDFMKNVPNIIQRGNRLEELLKNREELRAEEARNSLRNQQQSMSRAENDLDTSMGGTDAVTEQTSEQMDVLASRLSALRGANAPSSDAHKRSTISGGSPMTFTRSGEALRDTGAGQSSSQPDSPRLSVSHAQTGLASPQLERSGFAGITDGGPHVGPDMLPTASEFDKSYPTLDAFESTQKQPHMPVRPLPVPPAPSSKPVPVARRDITLEEFFPLLHPGFDTVNDPQLGTRMVRRKAPHVLLLDVRPRAEWQKAKIKGVNSICIDTSVLHQNFSVDAIATPLTPTEQQMFKARKSCDLLVICDREGRGADRESLDLLTQLLVEDGCRAPSYLVGGVERWARKVGAEGIEGDYAKAVASTTSHSSMPEYARNEPLNADSRAKRQAVYMNSTPASLIPGHSAGSSSLNGRMANGTSSGYSGNVDLGDTLSMPPRTYQAAGNVGLPLSNGHAKQPHIPQYAANAPPLSSRQSHAPGSFDYPQLNANAQHGSLHSAYAAPTPPPAAAATSGLGMRSPSLEATAARANSMDVSLSRRPPVPSPYTGAPIPSLSVVRPHQSASYRTAPPRSEQYDMRIGLTGLKNMGNSCYMNSTLQCLSATIPLARFFLEGSYKKAINRVNPLGTQGALAEAFAQLIRVLWSEQYTFVSPVTFREAITRFAPAFRGYDQHDAQEFLSFLLDGLHEDLNYIKQKPPPVEMTPQREHELETLPQQVASVKEWSIYRERNDSLIVDWFQGQFRSKLTCLTCGKTSTTYNAFLYLSLPIPPVPRGADGVTLAQCLDAFTREEILDKADAWHCPRCNKARRATKKLTISRLPQVLLIHLKRFSFKGPFTDKIKTNVTFPTSNLDLTNYMPPPLPPGAVPKGTPISASQVPPYVYDLYGVTHHFGSLSGGHYTATIRTQGDAQQPQWMYCDDSRVTRADDREINSPSSYILWWHRKGR